MPSEKTHNEIDDQAEISPIESIWEIIRLHLENERARVNDEIRKYPTPITACDAQFNYLLEERVKLAEELDRLKVARHSLTQRAHLESLGEFIASSNYLRGEAEQTIRSALLSLLEA
jgi:chorismate mutase